MHTIPSLAITTHRTAGNKISSMTSMRRVQMCAETNREASKTIDKKSNGENKMYNVMWNHKQVIFFCLFL